MSSPALPKIATAKTSDSTLNLTADNAVKTRYVLVWITAMPYVGTDTFSGPGYKQAITDVKFTG